MEKLQYPIGKFNFMGEITEQQRQIWISEIERLPALLKAAVGRMSQKRLDTPYRPDGWTVRQVVHHIADSHMNSFIRFKLALTEDVPTIKPYDEAAWAELGDSKNAPIEQSLSLIESLQTRWVMLLRSLSADDYKRTFYHPQSGATTELNQNLGIYAWHGKHHLAQITALIQRMGWDD